MAAPRINPKQVLDAENIVIVGDGPMALIAAIKLKQLGVRNVTVVGPHLGIFHRSGDFHLEVFPDVSQFLNIEVKPSSGKHIKDVERQLYDYANNPANNLKINFIKGKFIGFKKGRMLALQVKANNESDEKQESNSLEPTLIKADMVIDCTGTTKAVLKEFNDQIDLGNIYANKFTFSKMMKTPFHYMYALMRIQIPVGKVRTFFSTDYKLEPNSYLAGLEQLGYLGCERFALPYSYANPAYKAGDSIDDPVNGRSLNPKIAKEIRKVNFYLQVPPNLPLDKLQEYAKIIYKILFKTMDDSQLPTITPHKKSSKYANKAQASIFKVDPETTNEAFAFGNKDYSNVFHWGDSSANAPFFLGQSLRRGIDRLELGLNCFKIIDGMIKEINLNDYEAVYKKDLMELIQVVEGILRQIEATTNAWKLQTFELYKEKWLDAPLQDLEKILSNLLIIEPSYIFEFIKQIEKNSESISDPVTGFQIKNLFFRDKFKEMVSSLKLLHNRELKPVEIQALSKVELKFAERCKLLGNHYVSKDPKLAHQYYTHALDIYLRYPKENYVKEKLALYSNLIFLGQQQKNLNNVLAIREQAMGLLPCCDRSDLVVSTLLDKINGNTCRALLNAVNAESEAKEVNQSKIEDLFNKADLFMREIKDEKILKPIKEQYEPLHRKLSKMAEPLPSAPHSPPL